MENEKKCSFKNHGNINAISYCLECNIYMCNKCISHHSEFLDNHHQYNLDNNIEQLFTGICKEIKHKQELEFFCKNHNQLCCPACLSKIKGKGFGQHADCNVCFIEDIKDEKKQILDENIKIIEDFSKKIDNQINKLKILFEEVNKNKEELKLKISKIFTKIRNIINEREDNILLEVDNKFNNLFIKEDIIKKSEKLPNEIKINIEKGKKLNEIWNDNKINLNSKINDCINIENNINNINEINKSIEKYNSQKINIEFIPEKDDEINQFLEKIQNFGKITEIIDKDILKFKFSEGKNYSVSNNGLVATKTKGGDNWNCTIIGDKEIPKNKISKWKIRINNFEIKKNEANILIGIGPKNINNESNFYIKCWCFVCGTSKIVKKNDNETKYNNHSGKLKKGDIITVIIDRKIGNLSFHINDSDYGIAVSEIPKDDILYPIVLINDQNQIVEIL